MKRAVEGQMMKMMNFNVVVRNSTNPNPNGHTMVPMQIIANDEFDGQYNFYMILHKVKNTLTSEFI